MKIHLPSGMNSIFRSIDLTTFIVAPSLVGFVMSYFSPMAAAIFLGSWNVGSLVVEYLLLVNIFARVPALALSRSQAKLTDLVRRRTDSDGGGDRAGALNGDQAASERKSTVSEEKQRLVSGEGGMGKCLFFFPFFN